MDLHDKHGLWIRISCVCTSPSRRRHHENKHSFLGQQRKSKHVAIRASKRSRSSPCRLRVNDVLIQATGRADVCAKARRKFYQCELRTTHGIEFISRRCRHGPWRIGLCASDEHASRMVRAITPWSLMRFRGRPLLLVCGYERKDEGPFCRRCAPSVNPSPR